MTVTLRGHLIKASESRKGNGGVFNTLMFPLLITFFPVIDDNFSRYLTIVFFRCLAETFTVNSLNTAPRRLDRENRH